MQPRRGHGGRRGRGWARAACPRRPSRPAGRHRPRWCRDSRSSAGRHAADRFVQVEHRIAGLVRGDRSQDMGHAGQRIGGRQGAAAIEGPDAPALGGEGGRLVRARGSCRGSPSPGRPAGGPALGRIAEAEAEQVPLMPLPPIPRAPRDRSPARPHASRPVSWRDVPASSRRSAQTAAPRTSGERVAEQPLRDRRHERRSPLLPIAISTLRTKRSRPIRLTGLPANRRAEARIVQAGQLGQRRRDEIVARLQLQLAARLRELVPRADGQTVVAAVDAVAHGPAQLARDRALCSMVR